MLNQLWSNYRKYETVLLREYVDQEKMDWKRRAALWMGALAGVFLFYSLAARVGAVDWFLPSTLTGVLLLPFRLLFAAFMLFACVYLGTAYVGATGIFCIALFSQLKDESSKL